MRVKLILSKLRLRWPSLESINCSLHAFHEYDYLLCFSNRDFLLFQLLIDLLSQMPKFKPHIFLWNATLSVHFFGPGFSVVYV